MQDNITSGLSHDNFHKLHIDQDCVLMSKFVQDKLGRFENGKVFYEFTRDEEDIFNNTEVVLWNLVSVVVIDSHH